MIFKTFFVVPPLFYVLITFQEEEIWFLRVATIKPFYMSRSIYFDIQYEAKNHASFCFISK